MARQKLHILQWRNIFSTQLDLDVLLDAETSRAASFRHPE